MRANRHRGGTGGPLAAPWRHTTFFYKAAINGGEDVGKVAERLLRNQDDIGNAVKPFYGDAAGSKVASLLRDHILIAADLVKAA